jgi:predicted ATPase
LNTKRIVITGGPGTGKTSIINALKDKKFHCFDEIIRDLTLEAKKEGDASTHVSNPINFVNDPETFNSNLINGRVAQFLQANTIKKEICFFDRGVPDVLAYMDFFNQDYNTDFIDPCENHKYDMVFLLPPCKAIYKSDNERFETFHEAQQIHNHLTQVYKKFGYHINEVPLDTIESRTNFILNCVEQY